MQDSGTAIMHAAAQVRQLLIAQAAQRAGVPAEQMTTDSGAVIAPDGRRFGYGDLVASEMLHVQASPQSVLKDPAQYKFLNRRIPRVDIPAKVTGGEAFVQDFRPDGMVHGRIVRPPSYGAVLESVDTSAVEKMPGVLKVVRDGSFLAVIAEREFQAIEAMRALAAAARWQESAKLPDMAALPALLAGLPAQGHQGARSAAAGAGKRENNLGDLYPALRLARFDRPVLRGGAVAGRCADGVDPHPRRLPGSRRHRRNDAHAEGESALHPCPRLGLLRPQRRRRCRGRCRFAGARAARAGRCACSGRASRSTPGSRTAPP